MKELFYSPIVISMTFCLLVWMLIPASLAPAESTADVNEQSIDVIVIVAASLVYKAAMNAEYPLSEACETLIKNGKLPPAKLESGNFEFNIKPQEELITLNFKDQWFSLILRNSNSNEEVLKADFKDGEIGLSKGNLFVREGTKARLRDTVYEYTNGGWQAE